MKIKDEQHAVELWNKEMDKILNKEEPDWKLIMQLENDWNEAISPIVAQWQEEITRASVRCGLISKEEADKALAKRFGGKVD